MAAEPGNADPDGDGVVFVLSLNTSKTRPAGAHCCIARATPSKMGKIKIIAM